MGTRGRCTEAVQCTVHCTVYSLHTEAEICDNLSSLQSLGDHLQQSMDTLGLATHPDKGDNLEKIKQCSFKTTIA